jgi:hypothetical protein
MKQNLTLDTVNKNKIFDLIVRLDNSKSKHSMNALLALSVANVGAAGAALSLGGTLILTAGALPVAGQQYNRGRKVGNSRDNLRENYNTLFPDFEKKQLTQQQLKYADKTIKATTEIIDEALVNAGISDPNGVDNWKMIGKDKMGRIAADTLVAVSARSRDKDLSDKDKMELTRKLTDSLSNKQKKETGFKKHVRSHFEREGHVHLKKDGYKADFDGQRASRKQHGSSKII